MNSSEGAEKETPLKKGTQYQKKKKKKRTSIFLYTSLNAGADEVFFKPAAPLALALGTRPVLKEGRQPSLLLLPLFLLLLLLPLVSSSGVSNRVVNDGIWAQQMKNTRAE